MSAPSDSSHGKISISFTGLLYGVVIDAALHRFHSFDLTPAHFLLIVSLLLVVQDFFFYHLEIKEFGRDFEKQEGGATDLDAKKAVIARRSGKERKIFVLDIIVLASWYTLALSAERQSVRVYLVCLLVFFVSVFGWEMFAPPRRPAPQEGWRQRLRKFLGKLLRGLWQLARHPVKSVKRFWGRFWYTHLTVTLITAAVTALALLDPWGWFAHRNASGQPAHGTESPARFFSYWKPAEWAFLAAPLAALLVWRFFYWKKHAKGDLSKVEAEEANQELAQEQAEFAAKHAKALEEARTRNQFKERFAGVEQRISTLSAAVGVLHPLGADAAAQPVSLAAGVIAISSRLEQLDEKVTALQTAGKEVKTEVGQLAADFKARLQPEGGGAARVAEPPRQAPAPAPDANNDSVSNPQGDNPVKH